MEGQVRVNPFHRCQRGDSSFLYFTLSPLEEGTGQGDAPPPCSRRYNGEQTCGTRAREEEEQTRASQSVGCRVVSFVRSFKQDPEFPTPNTIHYAISLSADPPLPSRFSSTVIWIVSTYLSNNPLVHCPLLPLLLLINQRHAAIHEDGRIVIMAGQWHGMAWHGHVLYLRYGGGGRRKQAGCNIPQPAGRCAT